MSIRLDGLIYISYPTYNVESLSKLTINYPLTTKQVGAAPN